MNLENYRWPYASQRKNSWEYLDPIADIELLDRVSGYSINVIVDN